MRKFTVLLAAVLILFITALPALAVEIKGVVWDARTAEPLIGVNVYIEGANVGTTTDNDGFFIMEFESYAAFTITFSYVGYKTHILNISPGDNTASLEINLQEDVFESETIVVTGIASKTSKDIAEVAVSRVNAAELTQISAYQSMSQLVTGKIAGVQLKATSGNAGGGIRFFMRSGGGINGDEQPVIYVDGVRIDNTDFTGRYTSGGQDMSILANLNPEDIENIEVLKGPAGAATYGTSGSNGVVLITTKKGYLQPGKAGGISINYRYLYGMNNQSYEYKEEDFITAKDANKVFRDGPISQHTLSAAGGSSFLKYYVSFDSRDEDGILRNNFLHRKSIRANISAYPNDMVTLNVNTGYTIGEYGRPQNDNSILGYLGNTLLLPTPYQFTDSLSVENISDIHHNNQFVGSMQVSFMPFQNFEARFGIGIDNYNWRQDKSFPSNLPYPTVAQGQRSAYNRENRQLTYDVNVRYSYNIMPALKASTILGSQIFERKLETSYVQSEDFDTELVTDLGAGVNVKDWGESYDHNREAGVFLEHAMSYADQYYLTLGLRKDYASSIGKEAPSIFYPKVSFALRMDRYGFFPSMFNLMKLRFAYGESGVLPDPRDPILLLWQASPSGYGAGALLDQIGNDEIKPERIQEFEIGLETEFFTYYSAELTYYRQFANNSIIGRRNSPSTGLTITTVPFNVGGMESWGFESLLQARPLNTRDYQLNLSMIWNYQTNEVTDIGGSQPIYDPYSVNVIMEGLPKHEFHLEKVLGAEFDDDGNYLEPLATEDRIALGNPIPNTTGSFTINFRFLKNFQFYLMSDWAMNYKVYNNTKRFAIMFGNYPEYNKLEEQLFDTESDVYLSPGSPEYKAAADRYAKLDYTYKGNFIEDGDYFKLREISLSYSFKDLLSSYLNRQYVSDLIIGISARNIWTTTKYSGADMEVNSAGTRNNQTGADNLTRGEDFLTLQHPRVYNFWLRIML